MSALDSHEMECAADKFAAAHLLNRDGGIAEAVAPKVAPQITLLIWAVKEAFAPSTSIGAKSFGSHPPALERVARLETEALGLPLPIHLERLYETKDLLNTCHASEGVQRVAEIFRSALYSRRANMSA